MDLCTGMLQRVWAENGRFGVGTVCLDDLLPPPPSLHAHLTRSMGSLAESVIHGATLMPRPPGIGFDFSCIFILLPLSSIVANTYLLRGGIQLTQLV